MSETAALRDRRQVLDDGWLLMLLSAALAVGIPWFLRNSQVDLAPITWAVFLYGAGYLVVSRGIERLRGAREQTAALAALQALSVLFVAYLWHHAGNVQNPMFLMVFAIPVAAAGCVLPGARAALLALLAAASASVVALINAPQLRWYLGQLGMPLDFLPGMLPASAARPFPGMDLPAAYLFLLLVTFTVVVIAVALLSHSVALLVRGLQERLAASARALAQANSLAAAVIHAAPHPTVLVHAETLRVAEASRSFLERGGILPEAVQGQELFGLVSFAHPEVLRELMSGRGGEIPVAVYRAAGATYLARARVAVLEHGGSRYACVTLEDVLDGLSQQAAFDEASDALLVLGTDDRVQSFNRAAGALLPGLAVGTAASVALDGPDAASRWWVLGPRASRERTVTLEGVPCSARCTALAIPGLQERLTVVRLGRAP